MSWIAAASALGVAWLATYLLHSTMLLGCAYLLSRLLKRRPDWVESIWKVALLGGLITATAQTGLGSSPLGGQLSLGGAVAASSGSAPSSELPAMHLGSETLALAAYLPSASATDSAPAPAPSPIASDAALAHGAAMPAWAWLVVFSLYLVVALFFAARLWRGWRQLGRSIGARREVDEPEVLDVIAALRRASRFKSGLRVTASERVAAHFAMGVVRPEICLPERALVELDGDRRESLLAHELGHVVRRDPLWRLVGAIMTRAFFFQPLNYLAARELETLSELACDDFAAAHTRRPLALAHCLAEVATWTVSTHQAGPVAAMARRRSALATRVARLVSGDLPRRPLRAAPRVVALPAVVVGVFALAAPVVAGPQSQPPKVGAELAGNSEPISDRELARMVARALVDSALEEALARAPVQPHDEATAGDRAEGTPTPDVPATPSENTRRGDGERRRVILSRGDWPFAEITDEELRRMIPSDEEIQRMIPSEADIQRMIPSRDEILRRIPSEDDIRRMIPSEDDIRRMIPSEDDIRRMIPSEDDIRRMIPSEDDIRRMIPSEDDIQRMLPSEDDIRRMILRPPAAKRPPAKPGASAPEPPAPPPID
jgi:beta-lactamase regulating signal transducer with metallopeptidase domain